jgi:hypothetical protein
MSLGFGKTCAHSTDGAKGHAPRGIDECDSGGPGFEERPIRHVISAVKDQAEDGAFDGTGDQSRIQACSRLGRSGEECNAEWDQQIDDDRGKESGGESTVGISQDDGAKLRAVESAHELAQPKEVKQRGADESCEETEEEFFWGHGAGTPLGAFHRIADGVRLQGKVGGVLS